MVFITANLHLTEHKLERNFCTVTNSTRHVPRFDSKNNAYNNNNSNSCSKILMLLQMRQIQYSNILIVYSSSSGMILIKNKLWITSFVLAIVMQII